MQGKRYNHLISHGFTLEEGLDLATLQERSNEVFDGFLVSLQREATPWTAAAEAAQLAADLGTRIFLYLKSTTASPAEAYLDDAGNAERVAESLMAGLAHDSVDIILDNFTDSDRGYFVRSGLVDRRYNPRLAGRAVTHLLGLLDLSRYGWRPGPVNVEGVSAALTSNHGTLNLIKAGHDCDQVSRGLTEQLSAERTKFCLIHLGQDDMTAGAGEPATTSGPRCLWVPREHDTLSSPTKHLAVTA